jgi:hypothetical protein
MSQMPLPQTSVEVASAAMVLLGMRPMTSFQEVGRDEVYTVSALYELAVGELAEAHPWKFCQGQQILENDPVPPLDRYDTAWLLPRFPNGVPYTIHTVRLSDWPVGYEIMGQRIYCDAGPSEAPVAEYTYRVDEAYWPPSFKMCVVFRLGSMLANAITRKKEQIAAMDSAYEIQLGRARFRDAKSVTVKRMDQTRFLRNRRTVTSR